MRWNRKGSWTQRLASESISEMGSEPDSDESGSLVACGLPFGTAARGLLLLRSCWLARGFPTLGRRRDRLHHVVKPPVCFVLPLRLSPITTFPTLDRPQR